MASNKKKRKKKKPYYRKAGSRASPFLLDDATPRLEEIAAEFSWTSNTVNGCRLVVVIPIVWESCVWLRPVGVVSIASCSIQQNESPVCVGVFLSYRVFSLAIFRCAVQFYSLHTIFIILIEIPRGLEHTFDTKSFFLSFPPLLFLFFFF